MKIAIVYAGKTGTTQKCALHLKEKLVNADVYELSKDNIAIGEYDMFVIGASIRMGMMHKVAKDFITKYKEELKRKKIAIYVCCASSENKEQYFKTNLPEDILSSCLICDSFGGEMDMSKQKGFDKIIAAMVTKAQTQDNKLKIDYDAIDRFAEVIKGV